MGFRHLHRCPPKACRLRSPGESALQTATALTDALAGRSIQKETEEGLLLIIVDVSNVKATLNHKVNLNIGCQKPC